MKPDFKAAHVAAEFDHASPFITCRFDPTGKFVFATAEDRSIVRLDLADPKKKTVFTGHDGWVWALAFSRDAQTLVSAGADDTPLFEVRETPVNVTFTLVLAGTPYRVLHYAGTRKGNDLTLESPIDGEGVYKITARRVGAPPPPPTPAVAEALVDEGGVALVTDTPPAE